jgi:hypothetical protein
MKNTKAKIGDIVEVVWLDAAGQMAVDRDLAATNNPTDLCVVTHTYGILHKEDKLAVIILQEDSQVNVDYAAIPKGMILEIRRLKYA